MANIQDRSDRVDPPVIEEEMSRMLHLLIVCVSKAKHSGCRTVHTVQDSEHYPPQQLLTNIHEVTILMRSKD